LRTIYRYWITLLFVAIEIAGEAEQDQRVESMERANTVYGLADPREHDLDGDGNRDCEREQDAPLPEPTGKSKQQAARG
jgi:hypothetical protein